MNRPVPARIIGASLLFSTILAGCGWGILDWGGGGGGNSNKVIVVGNLRDIAPVTARDIVIFVFNVNENDDREGDLCPCPGLPCNMNSGQAIVVESGEDEFEITRVHDGAIRVVFLLDNPGDDADGQIDDGDLVAILDDVDCELEDVPNKRTVTLEDVDLFFGAIDLDGVDARCDSNTTSTTEEPDFCQINNAPGAGRARADEIRITESDDNNNNDDEEN